MSKELERISEEYDRIEEEEKENQSASYVDYRFDSTGKIDEQHWKRILGRVNVSKQYYRTNCTTTI